MKGIFMQTRQFGKTDMQITPIGIGAWAIGGTHGISGWGSQDDKQSIETIKRGLGLGINWIDTAAIYGFGHSEEVVGKAIKGREKPYIFTKCARVWDENRNVNGVLKADSILRECEASLKRLGVDTIDLYQIHWPSPDADLEEGWTALAQLKKEGKVRHIGVSNFNVEQLKRAEKIAPVETLQPPYSLLNQSVQDEILPYCLQHNIGVIAYSPMASGLLTGRMTKERVAKMPDDDWRSKSPEFQGIRLEHNLELANLLSDIAFPHNVTAGVVAVAWTLQNQAITAAIVGSRSTEQIQELIAAAEFRLSDTELAQINTFVAEHP
jgi:aryl-alcohol dehydrogenase-like predicted oxidoreductase